MRNQPSIGKNVIIHPTATVHANVVLGDGVFIGPYCIIGEPSVDYYRNAKSHQPKETKIGAGSVIRSHSVIYEDVQIGEQFQTGHHVTIREDNIIGDHCSVGSYSDIQDQCRLGNYVRLHSNVFLGQFTEISDYAWLFPHVVATNDKYPPHGKLQGCKIGEYALVAAQSLLLPGVRIGANALVAAGAVVTKDVLDGHLAVGAPARDKGLVSDLTDQDGNLIYPWRDYLEENRGYPWQNN